MKKVSERILVIRHGAFGDIVQADGALRDIRAFHADAEIVLLTTPPFRRLMERCPHIDRILLDDRSSFFRISKTVALGRVLSAEGFSRVYDLQSSQRTNFYRRFLLRDALWSRNENRKSASTSDREAYATQLADAGVAVRHASLPDVSWMADDVRSLLSAEGIGAGYIMLIPGCAAKHQHKRWPYYAELSAALLARGYQVLMAPGPDELELAKTIPGNVLLGPKGFLNWFELAGVLKGAAFVIGNDTGPSHVASCLGRPGLVLFGSHTSAQRTGILRDGFSALEVGELSALSMQVVLDAVLKRLHALYGPAVSLPQT